MEITRTAGATYYKINRPRGEMKYLDWNNVREAINNNPSSTIRVGIKEDWEQYNRIIYSDEVYYMSYLLCSTAYGNPAFRIDDGEITESWTLEKTETGIKRPAWWGKDKDGNPLTVKDISRELYGI